MDLVIDINVCRSCCKTGAEKSIHENNYKEMFFSCTNIQIVENDGMPSRLCNRCLAKLKIAYEFKFKSSNSDKQLRAFIGSVRNQFRQTVEQNESDEDILLPENENDSADKEETSQQFSNTINEQITCPTTDARPLLMKSEGREIVQVINIVHDDGINRYEPRQSDTNGQQKSQVFLLKFNGEEDQTQNETQAIAHQNESENMNEFMDIQQETQNTIQHTVYEVYSDEVYETEKEASDVKSSSQVKDFHCGKCDKYFSTKTNLYRHINTHDGSKPYSCHLCKSCFTQHGSLKQHMLIHTGDRPFVCSVCDRGFTQAKSLKFHLRRHTGERPYACEKCPLTFRQKDGLKRHTQVKHTNISKIFKCHLCPKAVNSKYALAIHIKRHHSQINTSNVIKTE